MRCPDCSKFVSMDNGEPEENSIDCSLSGGVLNITAEYRHTRNCADCGTELKDFTFDLNEDVSFGDLEITTEDENPLSKTQAEALEEAWEDGSAEVSIEANSAEIEEDGGGRYKANKIRLVVDYTLTIQAGKETFKATRQMSEETTAGSYDECC